MAGKHVDKAEAPSGHVFNVGGVKGGNNQFGGAKQYSN